MRESGERQTDRQNQLLKFRFAKKHKNHPFSEKQGLSAPQRIDRAKHFSYHIRKPSFSAGFKPDGPPSPAPYEKPGQELRLNIKSTRAPNLCANIRSD